MLKNLLNLKQFQRIFESGLDLLLPPICILCQASSPQRVTKNICPTCWPNIFSPLTVAPGVFAGGFYNDPLRKLIHNAKFHAEPLSILALSHFLLLSTRQTLNEEVNVLVSIPGDPRRIRRRGIDLPRALAEYVGMKIQKPVDRNLLFRTANPPTQTSLTREERLKNLQHAFAAHPSAEGKTVLLIDDVFTTGATAQVATNCLKMAGARSIIFSVLAYTNRRVW